MVTMPVMAVELLETDGETVVSLRGSINENCDFQQLKNLAGRVIFDLAGVQRINSDGVRRWIDFLRGLDHVSELVFVRCSVAIVAQLNMIRGFSGQASIESFYAPYICPSTEHEELRLLMLQDVKDPLHPPTFPCSGGVLELDDLPERYFAFLRDQF
jgi:hypothetical protein